VNSHAFLEAVVKLSPTSLIAKNDQAKMKLAQCCFVSSLLVVLAAMVATIRTFQTCFSYLSFFQFFLV
jgi:hypothetical protein